MNKTEKTKKCKEILSSGLISEVDKNWLIDNVFSNHPKWEDKKGIGVKEVVIKIAGNWSNNCFHILRKDNTLVDISYLNGIRKINKKKEVDKTLRSIVSYQITEFRNNNNVSEGMEIDHYGIEFKDIINQFMKSYSYDYLYSKIITTNSYDNSFNDDKVVSVFCDLHKKLAKLQALTVEEHKQKTHSKIMILRKYQKKIVSELRNSFTNSKRSILCAPTGSGKTIMFTYMVSEAVKRNKKVLVLTHRQEILNQSNGSFGKFGLEPELIIAGKNPDLSGSLFIGMVETVYQRAELYKDFLSSMDLVICDEAHLSNFDKLFPYFSKKTYIIGATATPFRRGKQSPLSDFYSNLVDEVSVRELIDLKYLVSPRSYGVTLEGLKSVKKTAGDFNPKAMGDYYEENKTYKGVLANYERLCLNKKTIVFTPNIESSELLRDQFVIAGYDAKHLDGKTKQSTRREILDWFNSTPNAIICNCGVLTTGFDEPSIECVILYRATTSRPLFMQMVGRGGRVYPNKSEFFILDFGENFKRFGKWEDPIEWSLEKKPKTKEGAAPVKNCPKCDFMTYASTTICEECGHKFVIKKTDEEIEIELKEIVSKKTKGRLLSEMDIEELILLQESKIISSALVWRIVRSHGKDQIKYYAQKKGYSTGWIFRQYGELNNCKFNDYRL